MTHPVLRRLLPALLALSLLTGCGGETPTETGPVSITVWTYYNGAQLSAFNELVSEFNATVGAEEGIFVEASSLGSVTDLSENVMAAISGKVGAGEVPNIFAAYADTAYTVDQMGLVVDLGGYLTQEELAEFVPSYIDEGRFSNDESIKIFPVAKSVELLLLNRTDWDAFAQATGAQYQDFATIEGLTATAQAYYEWTDSLTEEPNDGHAFFGRDAMANYSLIGAMQLGTELFEVRDGVMTLHFDEDVVRKLWDNYYVPYIKGYFISSGRFRSDDVKTGNILAFVGASSGATFFPDVVNLSDTESHPIEMEVLPAPQFAGGAAYAVQQGAGMVVTAGEKAEEAASVEFLKWFVQKERNIYFSLASGYLPVTREANDLDAIKSSGEDLGGTMEGILTAALDTVNQNTLYTPLAFSGGAGARSVLETAMQDRASADRDAVKERLAQGMTLEEACAPFTSDEYFKLWYHETKAALEAQAG